MTYIEKLNPWCIVRHFPNMQNKIVARFRRRNDAEAHLTLCCHSHERIIE